MNSYDSILVTGSKGLLGSALVTQLKADGYKNIIEHSRDDCDLTDPIDTRSFFIKNEPDYVFHAAARVYGIMGNINNKALSFYENIMINTNVIDASYRSNVKKITAMGTGAIYPFPSPSLPLEEKMIFMGEPHHAENSYAHSKRSMLSMLEAYEDSYGLEWAYIISCNLFGPGDKFDTLNGHVIPSLIKKFYDAKKSNSNVVVWGDGSAQRDFMYVKDAARVSVTIMKDICGPANIGCGLVYSIQEIVNILASITDMEDMVVWDNSKPNGQDYRQYDLSKITSKEFKCLYSIRQGLQETWDWYVNQIQKGNQ